MPAMIRSTLLDKNHFPTNIISRQASLPDSDHVPSQL